MTHFLITGKEIETGDAEALAWWQRTRAELRAMPKLPLPPRRHVAHEDHSTEEAKGETHVEEFNVYRYGNGGGGGGAMVFCNFNHLYKLDKSLFKLYCEVLAATPHSVLWLMKLPAEAEQNLKREAVIFF